MFILVFDAVVFAADVLLWAVFSVVEVVFTALYNLLVFLVSLTVVAAPVLLEGIAYGAVQLLEVLVNVSDVIVETKSVH